MRYFRLNSPSLSHCGMTTTVGNAVLEHWRGRNKDGGFVVPVAVAEQSLNMVSRYLVQFRMRTSTSFPGIPGAKLRATMEQDTASVWLMVLLRRIWVASLTVESFLTLNDAAELLLPEANVTVHRWDQA